MELEHNPILQREDYLEGYRQSVDNLKNRPEILEFDKATYELFATPQGKKWLELVEERFLIPSLVNRASASYPIDVIWSDGFKDFPRMINQYLTAHEQRIKAEMNK